MLFLWTSSEGDNLRQRTAHVVPSLEIRKQIDRGTRIGGQGEGAEKDNTQREEETIEILGTRKAAECQLLLIVVLSEEQERNKEAS